MMLGNAPRLFTLETWSDTMTEEEKNTLLFNCFLNWAETKFAIEKERDKKDRLLDPKIK